MLLKPHSSSNEFIFNIVSDFIPSLNPTLLLILLLQTNKYSFSFINLKRKAVLYAV